MVNLKEVFPTLADQLRQHENVKESTKQSLQKKTRARQRKQDRRKRFREAVLPMHIKIKAIEIDGLSRTHTDVILPIIQPLFEVQNYGEAIKAIKDVHQSLKFLGCFSKVDIFLNSAETSAHDDDDDVSINIKVEELGRCTVDTTMKVLNHGDLAAAVGLKTPNIFGRGETGRIEASLGCLTSCTYQGLALFRSFFNKALGDVAIIASAFRSWTPLPWRGLKSTSFGANLAIVAQPKSWWQQTVKIEALVRQLMPLHNSIDFNARSECGFSVKTSLSHVIEIDTRNDRQLPSSGMYLQCGQEVASSAWGGNSDFAKFFLASSLHYKIFDSVSLALGGRIGMVRPLWDKLTLQSLDSFCFENKMLCRGFDSKQLGHYDFQHQSANLLAISAKLNLPFPFLRQQSYLQKNCQTFLFCDAGGVTVGSNARPTLTNANAGVGLAMRLGSFGRAELLLLRSMFPSEKASARLQFGFGIDFL